MNILYHVNFNYIYYSTGCSKNLLRKLNQSHYYRPVGNKYEVQTHFPETTTKSTSVVRALPERYTIVTQAWRITCISSTQYIYKGLVKGSKG